MESPSSLLDYLGLGTMPGYSGEGLTNFLLPPTRREGQQSTGTNEMVSCKHTQLMLKTVAVFLGGEGAGTVFYNPSNSSVELGNQNGTLCGLPAPSGGL